MAILELVRAIFGNPRSDDERAHEQLVEAAIDKVVQGTDPRLVAVSGYRKKLREPVEAAIEYVRGLTDNFKEPLEVNRRTFASNAATHAFFVSADQIQEVFSLSQPVREFMAKPDNRLLDYFYAGLAMQNEEKRVLVSQLAGDQVQRDVARTAVNFSGHRVVIPCASREALHQEFIERAFFTLVECALRELTAVRKQHRELGRERSALRARLRAVESLALGMKPLTSGVQPSEDSLPGIEEQLLSTERELQDMAAGSGTLESHLDRVAKVLGQPSEHLRLTWASSRVTPTGFLAGADSREAAADVDYMNIEIVGEPSFVGRLVRYPCDEMLPLERFRPVL